MALSKIHTATNFDTELKAQVLNGEGKLEFTARFDPTGKVPDIGYGFALVTGSIDKQGVRHAGIQYRIINSLKANGVVVTANDISVLEQMATLWGDRNYKHSENV